MREIIRIVGEIHKRGVIHRDIKDSNIMINSQTLEVTLIDFGISDTTDVIKADKGDSVTGTEGFIAPEHELQMKIK